MLSIRKMKVKTFQYISALIEYQSLQRLINRTNKYANVIIDLEDSIMDVNSKNETSLHKHKARKNLRRLLDIGFDLEIGIRINSINSIEFEKDIELLEELNIIDWRYIVLPKIESHIELQQYLSKLEVIGFQEIVICIESEKGVEQLNSILRNNRSKLLSKVQFGHFDYFLSTNTFPIPNQTEPLFWKTCQNIIEIAESNGYMYLHSPLSSLNSRKLMHRVLGKLKDTCKHEFGFASVSLDQSICLFYYKKNQYEPLIVATRENKDITAYAEKIKYLFTQSKNNRFSFHHKNQNGKFIPPQEYIAATNFLTKHGN